MSSVPSKMRNAKSIVDDLVYTMLSEVGTRLLEVTDKKVARLLIDEIQRDYDMGVIPVRKKPTKSAKPSGTKKDNNYVSNVVKMTREKMRDSLNWEECREVPGMPKDLSDMLYCFNNAFELEEGCALIAQEEDEGIVVMGIINSSFQVRYVSTRESKIIKRFDLNIQEDNIVSSSKAVFIDV